MTSEASTAAAPQTGAASREELESVVVRFAGDSGDGMQLTGTQFTLTTAFAENDLATFPDFPAEIRAPAGSTFGVSAFQIHFGSHRIRTVGDALDALVAMNPAALKVELGGMREGGLVIVDTGAFSERNLRKAGYATNPLEDGGLDGFRTFARDISKLTLEAVAGCGLSRKESVRCKNMWALGLVYWLYDRDRRPTTEWLREKFAARPDLARANIAALDAGYAHGEIVELPQGIGGYAVPPAEIAPGLYRAVTGGEALALGLVTGGDRAGLELVFSSYPITPASPILHAMAAFKSHGVVSFQAEDEIAAACCAIGASYAGALGVTSSSGPGMALKAEALGLAVTAELPLVVIDSQRAGPSTGMPTKTEQSDLYQALFGRNADSPVAVLAPRSPADCFAVAIEAVRLATMFMTPVIVLSDTYLANAAEPWRIPDIDSLPRFPVVFRTERDGGTLRRDETTLARPWIRPGTPGLESRIGGLEKDYDTGHISYDPENHARMTAMRANKIAGIAEDIPPQVVDEGGPSGKLAVVGWGSSFGPIGRAVQRLRADGLEVSHVHIRHLYPLPRNLGELLAGFENVLVPEMNTGQLVNLLRSTYLVPAKKLSKVTGQPFAVTEIESAVREMLLG